MTDSKNTELFISRNKDLLELIKPDCKTLYNLQFDDSLYPGEKDNIIRLFTNILTRIDELKTHNNSTINDYLLTTNTSGNTLLHIYLICNIEIKLDDIKLLLSNIKEHKIMINNDNMTPLHLFLRNNKFDTAIVTELLGSNNHKKMLDKLYNSPLDYCIKNKI